MKLPEGDAVTPPDDPLTTWPVGRAPGSDGGPAPSAALEHGPFLLHRNKGKEAFEAQAYARARRDLELAHRIRPEDPEVLYWLGMTYFRLDQHPEAERLFARLIELRPDVASLRVNRGIVLYKMGRSEEAEALFREALPLEGSGTRPHLYLGLIQARRGLHREALGHFEAAGAEVMAARMRTRLSPGPVATYGTVTPAAPGPEAAPTTIDRAPHDLATDVGATRPGARIRRDASFSPHGKFLVEAAFSGLLLVRRGALAGFAGELQFEAAAEDEELLRVSGDGRVVLASEGRRLAVVPLTDGTLHVELGHFVACERTLGRQLLSLGRRDGLGLRAVGLTGEGIVVLATGGAPMIVPVSPEAPVSLAADLIVGWSGSLEPSLLRQGSLEDRAIRGAGGALKLRFRGHGQLLLDHRREEGL